MADYFDKKLCGLIDAKVETGVAPTADPYASLPLPSKGTSYDVKDFLTTVDKRQYFSLRPGSYKDLQFDSNDVVTMEPGTYHITGKFELKSSSSLYGDGVTVFQDGKKGMKFNTTGDVTISPPTSGTYKGITLFQTPTAKAKLEFKGGRNYEISGVIYCPNGEVKFSKTDLSSKDEEDWEADADAEAADGPEDDFGTVAVCAGRLDCRQATDDR